MTTLSMANDYGSVDIRNGLSRNYVHVGGKRLQPLCRRLGIKYAEALIGFAEGGRKGRFGYSPKIDGVVVSARSAPKLLAAIKEREERANTPASVTRRKKAKQARARQRQREEDRKQERCRQLGIDPKGRTAEWLNNGDIDADHAELIGFKVMYRHEFTDYDDHFDWDDNQPSRYRIHDLRDRGYSLAETRQLMCDERRERREEARSIMNERPIPGTWSKYLDYYGFSSHIAQAMAGILKDPHRCHPRWFKEAEIAVRRVKLPLDKLTYKAIARAISDWRDQRYGRHGDQAAALLREFFLVRDDVVCVEHLYPDGPAPTPARGDITKMLYAHVAGRVAKYDYGRTKSRCQVIGTKRIGAYTPDDSGNTKWACIDFDGGTDHVHALQYPILTAQEFVRRCDEHDVPVYLEMSKSAQGLHAWIFCQPDTPAWATRRLAFGLLEGLNAPLQTGGLASPQLGRGIEVFPKADFLRDGGIGSQVWLPWYCDAAPSGNVFVRWVDGELEEFTPEGFERCAL